MLLAIDTSTQWTGLALYDGNQVIGEVAWLCQNRHTVELAPALENLFNRCGVKPADLQVIGCALGPGSFTALRIGLAVAKGLALALKLPLIGVPSLDILAQAQSQGDNPLAAILQAGRGRLAISWYTVAGGGWHSDGKISVMTVDDLSTHIRRPTLVCGELTADERQILARKRKNVILASPANSIRRPAILAELCWQRWLAGKQDEVVNLSPIYLHLAENSAA